MSCDVGEVTERLENELCSNPSITLSASQLILQPFFCFSYVTGSSLTSPGELPMDLRHSSLKFIVFQSTHPSYNNLPDTLSTFDLCKLCSPARREAHFSVYCTCTGTSLEAVIKHNTIHSNQLAKKGATRKFKPPRKTYTQKHTHTHKHTQKTHTHTKTQIHTHTHKCERTETRLI